MALLNGPREETLEAAIVGPTTSFTILARLATSMCASTGLGPVDEVMKEILDVSFGDLARVSYMLGVLCPLAEKANVNAVVSYCCWLDAGFKFKSEAVQQPLPSEILHHVMSGSPPGANGLT